MEIDKTNLSRDYSINPLQKRECPPYEDLYYLYITENLSVEEIGKIIGLERGATQYHIKKYKLKKSKEQKLLCRQRLSLERYGVTSPSKLPSVREKVEQTFLAKYGVMNPNKCPKIRAKIEKTNMEKYGCKNASASPIAREHYKQTCLEKYGVEAHTQAKGFQEKIQQICLDKYGERFPSKLDWIKEKTKQINMEKYGVPWVMMNPDFVEKRKQTCLERWGTDNISTRHLSPDSLQLLNNKEQLWKYIQSFELKNIQEIANTLGVTYDGLKKKLQEFNLWDKLDHYICYAETELRAIFPEFYRTKSIISPYEIDLYSDDYKIGIEYNGGYWHSEKFKDKNYHQQKSLLAKEQGIFLYHIFEYEWIDERKRSIILSQLNNLLRKNPIRIGARKCMIKNIPANICNQFLQENHLQGKDQSSVRFGLYYRDTLVSVMTFCKPRFNKHFEWELSRFCNKIGYSISGSASRLFKHFIKNINPQNIISYSNFAKTRGTVYEVLGFQNLGLTSPNYVWIKSLKALSRYQCQKHLLKDFKHLGNTEDEIMHNRGYLKCYDCGSYKWVWYNNIWNY